MDDLTEKLQSLLSDPESLQNLASLAAMMQAPQTEDDSGGTQSAEAEPADEAEAGFDFSKLLLIGEIMAQMQEKDKETELLLALKPYLSEERSKRVDRAVKLLRLYSIAISLKEKGLLSDLAESL